MAHSLKRCLLITSTLVQCWRQAQAQSSACPDVPRVIVYEQAVSINTDVLYNTTFYPVPQYPYTVSNAPTSINELTTLQWTSVEIPPSTSQSIPITQLPSTLQSITTSVLNQTLTASLTTSTVPQPTESTFLLGGITLHLQKRQQNYNYITGNGTMTSDCTSAVVYSLNNGQLSVNVSGQVSYFSTSPGVATQPFAPSALQGSITNTFSIQHYQDKQVLSWENNAFYNNEAYFCSLDNGTVYAVFQQSAQPDGCFYFRLVLYSAVTCQGVVPGPSGPTGPTDK